MFKICLKMLNYKENFSHKFVYFWRVFFSLFSNEKRKTKTSSYNWSDVWRSSLRKTTRGDSWPFFVMERCRHTNWNVLLEVARCGKTWYHVAIAKTLDNDLDDVKLMFFIPLICQCWSTTYICMSWLHVDHLHCSLSLCRTFLKSYSLITVL